ncbi:MAG: energy-coupling factor transporter transmembrane protein EcfT [Spirochaetaceae bacterium]|jgi:energy-coupling factor transport system permease protein|nr:energy-coupling factor transporter transmembrane protein EcfT [Spirochaetaceae bacterium]
MNNRFIINYVPGTTALHRLNGATKLLLFLTMTVYVIMSFDVRVLGVMFALCAGLIVSMRPNWKPILFVTAFMTVTAGIVGSLIIILVKPDAGQTHVGGATEIIRWNSRFFLTWELLWYVGAMFFKRLCSLAAALVLVLSITPSEIASGLNALGLPYKACTIISLAFRAIPDVARDFLDIKNALSLRGIELDPRRAGLLSRIRQTTLILVPLIMTSFGRVETIANAMDLRGFGKNRTRTWYRRNPPAAADWLVRAFTLFLAAFCVYYIARYRVIDPAPYDYWCPWIER